jgi:hypothetical protein
LNIYIIDPQEQTLQPHEFDGQITSIYTFFRSILVDHSTILKDHIIYTDANHADKNPFFIGEQLFLGKALVLGVNGEEERDITIKEEELSKLINYDINDFYTKSLDALIQNEINIYKTFTLDDQGKPLDVNYEWVLYTFNMADDKTQQYFLDELYKHIQNKQDISEYFKKMAQLAINAAAYQ